MSSSATARMSDWLNSQPRTVVFEKLSPEDAKSFLTSIDLPQDLSEAFAEVYALSNDDFSNEPFIRECLQIVVSLRDANQGHHVFALKVHMEQALQTAEKSCAIQVWQDTVFARNFPGVNVDSGTPILASTPALAL